MKVLVNGWEELKVKQLVVKDKSIRAEFVYVRSLLTDENDGSKGIQELHVWNNMDRSCRSAQATAGKGLAQGPYVAARAGVEPTTLRLKVMVSTKARPRPTIYIVEQ